MDWNAARAGSIADQAVSRAILSLLDDRAENQPRIDGVPAPLSIDGVQLRLWIQDESGKINLNFATKELLQSLFVSASMERNDAEGLADRIVARRTPAGPSIAFRSVDELLAVPGVTRAFFARIEPALTVYGKLGIKCWICKGENKPQKAEMPKPIQPPAEPMPVK